MIIDDGTMKFIIELTGEDVLKLADDSTVTSLITQAIMQHETNKALRRKAPKKRQGTSDKKYTPPYKRRTRPIE